MSLHFTKMHGIGNDFILIDATRHSFTPTPAQITAWSRRDTGIGFDQCLLVESSPIPGIDFFYRIFNANGQEVGQCGNGARCLARFVQHLGLTPKTRLCIQTHSTKMFLTLHADTTVSVEFPPPQLAPNSIPLATQTESEWYTLSLAKQTYAFHAIQVGNPHAVLLVEDIKQAPVLTVGQQLSVHAFFPEQANIGFMHILSPEHIQLRVYERGCGETQACGSGAIAAMAVGRLFHKLSDKVRVSLPGGDLYVTWSSASQPIFLRGPATFVYEGQILEDTSCVSSF
jgi:diaminopimelate epimerase